MKKLLPITLCLFVFLAKAQNENNWWFFGELAALDFNSGSPIFDNSSSLNSLEACASISDEFGNLKFYSDGNSIWNSLGNVLPNGNGLSGSVSAAQTLILQDRSISRLYYVITMGPSVRYSIIDATLDNNRGDIVPGRKDIILANINSEKIHGTHLANQSLIATFEDGVFYTFNVGGGTIFLNNVSDLRTSSIGNLTDVRGCLKISPDGTKIAVASIGQTDGLYIADLEVQTGLVSNPIHLTNSFANFNRTYGVEFSPDSRFLYAESNTTDPGNGCGTSNVKKILQYDTRGGATWFDNPIDISGDITGVGRGALQLAPDGKIYVAQTCQNYLGVIRSPNAGGTASGYVDNAVSVGTGRSREGLPNLIYTGLLNNNYNNINVNLSFDSDSNGCDPMDPVLPNFRFNIQSPNDNYIVYTDGQGASQAFVTSGNYTITPEPENPSYWNINPQNDAVNFSGASGNYTSDFCMTAAATFQDLEVVVAPIEQARPGFETDYVLRIKNKGNQANSGTLTLDFQEEYMSLSSSTPVASLSASNQLSWSFNSLQPQATQDFVFSMTLNTPTDPSFPLNSGEILAFTGNVNGQGADTTPLDNNFVLEQTVVNSYDPNDKICLEGETIEPAMVGEYVHYMIRFENTGTATAVNVVVEDVINLAQFDLTTLVPLGGSHDYATRIRDTNVVEFQFENINLDFNDATNDGHVLFKIKTLPTLIEGDVFENNASIYFDFNAPIITNTVTTTVQQTASLNDIRDESISLHPNPARNLVNLRSDHQIKSASLIHLDGRLISQTQFLGASREQRIDIGSLTQGIYFIRITSEKGQKTEKLVVQ